MPTSSNVVSIAAFVLVLSTAVAAGGSSASQGDVFDRVTHGTAVSEGGVKIHYASLGKGPLVVMIHGFPDFWYSWRHQMEALAQTFQVVAIDQRGYNQSDKPKGVENYDMRFLVGDVAAVIRHLGRDRATIVGHDWGGVVAWQFAMNLPQMTENLVILNLPHPQGMLRELRINAEQIKNSEYARDFQQKMPDDPTVFFGRPMTAENLAGWVRDPAARKHYIEAFKRSDFEAMLNYYKRNYPRQSGADAPPAARDAKGPGPGADVSRPARHRAELRRTLRHMELGGERPDARHRPRSGPLRPAGRGGSRHDDDEVVAFESRDRERRQRAVPALPVNPTRPGICYIPRAPILRTPARHHRARLAGSESLFRHTPGCAADPRP